MGYVFVFLFSLVVASFFGHFIHWALHQRWSGPLHRGHMDHHLYQYPPNDLMSSRYRTVKWYRAGTFLFTPAFFIILGTAGGLLTLLHVSLWHLMVVGPVLAGFGLLNDYVHDSMHVYDHWLERFRWFRVARVWHFRHHRNMKRNFGIVYFGWDRVFKTFKNR